MNSLSLRDRDSAVRRAYPYLRGPIRKLVVALYCITHCRKIYSRALAPAGKRHNPSTKFIILCTPRSGSSPLGSLIGSHPDVHWDKERFRVRYVAPLLLLNGLVASAPKKPCYGVKVFSNLFDRDSFVTLSAFLSKLEEQNWKIIHLVRRNIVRQAVSYYKADWLQQGFRLTSQQAGPRKVARQVIPPSHLMHCVQLFEEYQKLQQEAIGQRPCFRVTYEDDLETEERQKEVVKRIFAWMDLSPQADVRTDMRRQSAEDDYLDIAENKQQILATLNQSKYKAFLTTALENGSVSILGHSG